jgi:hypothetical protein
MISDKTAFFSRDPHGRLQIAFDDGVFARADVIFIDPAKSEISALLDGVHVIIGTVSKDMADSFMEHDSVMLTAPHPQGHELMLCAPILTIH